MNKILPGQDNRPLSEFKNHSRAFIDQVKSTKRPLVLTQRGKNAAVLLDVAEYEAMVYELELIRGVRRGEWEADNGMATPHEQVKKLLLKKLRDENQLDVQRAGKSA